jgi:hypothetical protein
MTLKFCVVSYTAIAGNIGYNWSFIALFKRKCSVRMVQLRLIFQKSLLLIQYAYYILQLILYEQKLYFVPLKLLKILKIHNDI